jgi:hypothetical protein
LAGCSITLDDTRSVRDLLMDLRGRNVWLLVGDGSNVAGTPVGLDLDEDKPVEASLVSLLNS